MTYPSSNDYTKRAIKYCNDVLSNKIPTSKAIKAACQKHLNDLKRQDTASFRYRFDEKEAQKVCTFVEKCTHIKGLPGEFIRLEDWQVWWLCALYGWVHSVGKKAGKRKYDRALIFVARGNGKTSISSALALYALTADEPAGGAYVVNAAVAQHQARLLFEDARHMALSPRSAKLMGMFGVQVGAHAITARGNSRFKPLSSESKSLDGLTPSTIFLDEISALDDRDLYDVLQSSLAKRLSTLLIMITTAGFDLSGIGYEIYEYAKKVLTNVIHDESFFAAIYELDRDDDWQDEENWIKANPNWDVSVFPDAFRNLFNEAAQVPSKQPNFLTKNLNQWLSSSHQFFDIPSWQACKDPALNIDDFKNHECFVGIDLASASDLACVSYVFRKEKKVFVFPQFYLPEAAVTSGRNAQYKGWKIKGEIKTTDGDILDYDIIESDILEACKKFQVHSINIDPYEATQLVTRLQTKIGSNKIITINQTAANLSSPTKELDALSRSGNLVHNSEVLIWNASNVICRYDTNDNIKPNKAKPENKIDGIIATICAMCSMMQTPEKKQRDWTKAISFV